MSTKISITNWGSHKGRELLLFKIENASGSYVELTNFGATLVSVVVPDKHNNKENVVLGFQNAEGYLEDTCYIGATIGRFANRIGNASFVIDGIKRQLERNDGQHSNHGGTSGFNSKVFHAEVEKEGILFYLLSEDGEGGYPGNLIVNVRYRWTQSSELMISYTAFTDKLSIANFTNHSYFNLGGDKGGILDHVLTVYSERMLESGEGYIPTGAIVPCSGLSFSNTKIKDRMRLSQGVMRGINQYYILAKENKAGLQLAAELSEALSGRILRVYTSYPGLMVYTGDFLSSRIAGHNGQVYRPFDGLCLECQYYPDSPNQPSFPQTLIAPGQVYNEHIVFAFGVI